MCCPSPEVTLDSVSFSKKSGCHAALSNVVKLPALRAHLQMGRISRFGGRMHNQGCPEPVVDSFSIIDDRAVSIIKVSFIFA